MGRRSAAAMRSEPVSGQAIEPEREDELRRRALAQLTGRADAPGPRATSAAALAALYALASSPATAGDALALLHEIQVHQVEVALQDEELRRANVELETGLARYVQLYDLAPFGYFTVSAGTVILELNLAGARLLGADRDALLGRSLEHLMAPESRGTLLAMLADARAGLPARTRTVYLGTANAARTLQARANADTTSGHILVALFDTDAGALP